MKNKFYIINTTVLKLPIDGTHILSNRKLAKGFKQNSYEIVEILNDEEVEKIENKKGNIIILSNFMDFKNDWDKIVDFGKKYDNLYYILWCWHGIPNPPFKYWTYTFQEYKLEPNTENFKNEYNLFKLLEKEKKFIQYRFSSYIDPNSNFEQENNVEKIYDVLYIGNGYELDKIKLIQNDKNIKSFIRIGGGGEGSVTGKEFEKLYRESKICLGFMAEENNQKNTITERIWEAFSFGCMVITNSKAAEIITNNTVVYYENNDDFIEKVKFYLSNDKKRKEKIKEGYKIFTSYGNYKKNALEFINDMNNKLNLK